MPMHDLRSTIINIDLGHLSLLQVEKDLSWVIGSYKRIAIKHFRPVTVNSIKVILVFII